MLDLYIKIGVFDKNKLDVLGGLPAILKTSQKFGLNLIKLGSRIKLTTFFIT